MSHDVMNLNQEVGHKMERNRGIKNDELKEKMKGKFHVEHYNDKGELLAEYDFYNGVTNGGRDNILNVYFDAATQTTTWYMGLIDNSGFSALAAGDTMSSHTGWTEFVSYSGGARGTWGAGASSGQSITNATAVTFNITSSGTVYGIFITSSNTLSGTSGTLWATGGFTSTVPVSNGDQLKVTYTISD